MNLKRRRSIKGRLEMQVTLILYNDASCLTTVKCLIPIKAHGVLDETRN